MKRNKLLRKAGAVLLQAVLLLLLILSLSLAWAYRNYGNIGFEEIVFHLRMPLTGTASNFINSYLRTALVPALAVFAAELFLLYAPTKNAYYLSADVSGRTWRLQFFPLRLPAWLLTLVPVLWAAALIFAAESTFGMVGYFYDQNQSSSFIEETYVDPLSVTITFPEEKRNLITIYVESAETSNQDYANGGMFPENFAPEMTRIARENISFSQSDLLEGAAVAPACGWTIAGLVAETAGLPLKLYAYDDYGLDNSMGEYATFMPGAVSLGDLLADAGYHNFFLAGSNFDFGGRTSYFTQHGSYEIFDYRSALKAGWLPTPDYNVWWGYEDLYLYDFAKVKLLELAAADEPFNFSMITADTHHEDGYYCALCQDMYDTQYANVWACASSQLDAFLAWLQEQDFYENTTIVICGDHCSMQPGFYPESDYSKHVGATERKVYNVFINAAAETEYQNNRLFTTLDIFPTTLASLGVQIEGDRLGLGTNLFSGVPTLAEEFGYETMFAEMNKRSDFYNETILFPQA